MHELAHFAGHAQQFLTTLTVEQGAALVGAACAVGRLLLQGLALLRAPRPQQPTAD